MYTGTVKAQTISNKGTEFWAVFPTHEADFDPDFNILYANLSIFITSDQASSGTVNVGSFSQAFTVSANNVTEIKIPREAAYIESTDANKVLAAKAVHIVVDPDMPKVVVYAHIFAGQRSAASLIFPKEALGQQYFSINYQQHDTEGKNYLAVVATEPNTVIRLKKNNIDLVPGGITLAHVNDVYEYLSPTDLTGVSVSVDASSACNRFALFSGSSGVSIGTDSCTPSSLDPLFQQNYPVENWGRSYGFIPFSTYSPNFSQPVRTTGQYLRILACTDATKVYINGIQIVSLDAGQFYTTPQPLTTAGLITSDKPICVAQYALSQLCSSTDAGTTKAPKSYSDPDMVILNPLDYSIKNITVYSSTKENISEQYLNILIKTDAAASFKVNNAAPVTPFLTSTSLPGYSYLQLNLNSYSGNIFHLTANDGFNAVAYGFGNVESYAYSAGTTLAATQSLSGIERSSESPIDTACVNDDYFFRLTLPYQASSIFWKMDDTENMTTQQNPQANVTILSGKTVYEYDLPKTPAYQTIGIHHATVTSAYPQIGACNAGIQQIAYTFLVKDIPKATFTSTAETCANIIDFKPTEQGSNNITWSWDFGDSETSTIEAPVHIYAQSGVYTVTLTAKAKNGCSNSTSGQVTIAPASPYPQIVFDALTPVCANEPAFQITAAREITGSPGSAVFQGDGITPDGLFSAEKAGIGTHQIQYIFTTSNGCVASKNRSIEVISAPFAADTTFYIFSNHPTLLKPRYSKGTFKYSWTPNIGLKENDVPFPAAKLDENIDYQVKISNNTCSTTAQVKIVVINVPDITANTFTPNGDGVNDQWLIKNINLYPKADVSIFNRYGSIVYHSIGYGHPWDGNYNGSPVPAGVYYYVINPGQGLERLSGTVTVIR